MEDQFCYGVAGLGDIDGDGAVDLAASALGDDDGGSLVGALYVLFLETNGNVKNAQKISMLYGNFNTFYTLEAGDVLGQSVAALGDVEGDGVMDLATGARNDDDGSGNAGATYVLSLESNGNVKKAQKISMLYGNFNAFYTLEVDDWFGTSVAALGDITGDSVVDLVVWVCNKTMMGALLGVLSTCSPLRPTVV